MAEGNDNPIQTGSSQLMRTDTAAETQEADLSESRGSSPTDAATSPELERRSSTGSSNSDASVAVNCSTMPAEVVVQGRRVQTVRLLFNPQPPPATVPPPGERRLRSSRKIAALPPRTGTSPTALSTQVSDGDVNHLHLPTEETVSDGARESTLPGIPSLPHSDSYTDTRITRITTSLPDRQSSSLPDSLGSSAGLPIYFSVQQSITDIAPDDNHVDHVAWEQERRVRQEVWSGLDFLERRNQVLRSTNARLVGELEMLSRENARLRQTIEETGRRFVSVESLSEELKIQLDQLSKENSILNEKAVDEWKLRVNAEERCVEEKRRGYQEIKSLKDQVERKNAELKLMESLIQNNNNSDDVTIDAAELKRQKEEEVRTDHEDIRDLVNRVTILKTTVDAIQNERNRLAGEVSHLSTEATNWRERFEAKCSEFDVLTTQFESLRLTLSHVQAENRNLRGQYVQIQTVPMSSKLDNGSGSGNATITGSLLNATWPKAESKPAPSLGANGTQLHHVQRPAAAPIGASSSSLKSRPASKESTGLPAMTQMVSNSRVTTAHNQYQQRRRKSDESTSGLSCSSVDSLPPVMPSQNHSTVSKFPK